MVVGHWRLRRVIGALSALLEKEPNMDVVADVGKHNGDTPVSLV